MNAIDPEQIYALIAQRRSIRRFLPQSVEAPLLEKILTAAYWAPSAHNRQPWRFVVVQDEHNKRLLADRMAAKLADDLRAAGTSEEAIAADTGRSKSRLIGAPVLIIMCLTLRDMDIYPDD